VTSPRIALDLVGLDLLWPGAGLYRYAVDLLHALRELAPPARFVVLGATAEPVPDLRAVLTAPGWDYLPLPRASGIAASYRDHVRLAVTLTRCRADLCHCLHMFAPAVTPCPVVVTLPDMMYELFPDYAEGLRSRPYRVFKWCIRRRVRRVICPSQTTATDLARLWGVSPRRIDVVPHGLRVFRPADSFPPEPTNEALRLLSAGPVLSSPLNLEPRKNLATLLKAFALLRPHFPEARLVLYGKGGWSDQREQKYRAELAVLGLGGEVVEPGVLTDQDLWWLYRRSTLFVFPTLYEGFGYPALEAMAAGTCSVVRGCSSMAEVVGPAGVQVEPLTAASLAATVGELLADEPRRRRLGELARARACHFTSERMAQGTFASYVRALRPARVCG
jgi:glycosyltransferase involved in cell wall biosynthesis